MRLKYPTYKNYVKALIILSIRKNSRTMQNKLETKKVNTKANQNTQTKTIKEEKEQNSYHYSGLLFINNNSVNFLCTLSAPIFFILMCLIT